MEMKVMQSSKLESPNVRPVDRPAEKRLIRKIDLHVIPILFSLFLCAFIDRINIGNARLQGLEEDLRMKGQEYNVALFVFFIPYILLEIPSNIALKRVRPSIWLGGIMFGWGLITICQGLTQSFAGLAVCRFLLGIFEAGFFPGAVYLISMYYKRHELQLRITMFICSGIVAGAISGLLAYAIAHMDGVRNYRGWRWIFILEGVFTCFTSLSSYWLIPDWPENARFLTPVEREMLLQRLDWDVAEAKINKWDTKAFKNVISDPKIYLGILMYLGIVNTSYSGAFFTPTILKQLGWTSIRAQVMSIPIYAFAAVVAIAIAVVADRLKHRFAFIIVGCCVATVGYVILLNMERVPVGVRYLAVYLITTGGYIAQPITLVWLSNNVSDSGHYHRGIAIASQAGLGNIGGLIASNIYLSDEAPLYRTGFGVSLALVWVCGLAAVAMLILLVRGNRARGRSHENAEWRFTY